MIRQVGTKVEVKRNGPFLHEKGTVAYIDRPRDWDFSRRAPRLDPPPTTWVLVKLDNPEGLLDPVLDIIPGVSEKGSAWFHEEDIIPLRGEAAGD